MRGLYIVVGVIMAGVSSVFALLAELEERYDLPTASLGWIAGSAFLAALVTQLTLARYADRGYARLLLRLGVFASAAGLLWFGLATELWQFVAARALLGAGIGTIMPPARRAIVLTSTGNQGERLGILYAAYLSGFVFGPPIAGLLTMVADVRLPFLLLGLLVVITSVWVAGIEMPEARRTGDADGPVREAGAAPTAGRPPGDRRHPDHRLVPLLDRRVRAPLGHLPRRSRAPRRS